VAPFPWTRFDRANAAGSIHASIRDMARWVRFQLGDGSFEGSRLLSKANFEETHTPQMVVRLEGQTKLTYPDTSQISYGLGWFIHDHRGHHLLSHTGGLTGYRARIVLVPKEKLGLVLLMNSGVGASAASMHYVVTNNLLDLLLGLPKKDWNAYYTGAFQKMEAAAKSQTDALLAKRQPGTKPSRELSAYAGDYDDPAYGKAQVAVEDGALKLSWGRVRVRLEHFHFDTFLLKVDGSPEWRGYDNQPLVFTLGADGTVSTIRWMDQEFKRVRSGTAARASSGAR
jgi:hypothetical protein